MCYLREKNFHGDIYSTFSFPNLPYRQVLHTSVCKANPEIKKIT